MSPAPTPQERAIAHVAARSRSAPLDPTLRVTLNFLPDRAAGGLRVVEAMRRGQGWGAPPRQGWRPGERGAAGCNVRADVHVP